MHSGDLSGRQHEIADEHQWWTRAGFAALSVALLVATGAHAADGDASVLVPADESVAGQSQAEWSRAWWQWAGSFTQSESPIADRTGALCASKQSGAVWFLAGTYGTRRTVRECTVPSGKYLFFPLVNYVVQPPVRVPVPCEALVYEAARMTDEASSLILEVDGVRIRDLLLHRQATPQCFPMGNLADAGPPSVSAAANGYYVMLRPLPRGRHVVNFGGALPSMLQGVTYTLTVQ